MKIRQAKIYDLEQLSELRSEFALFEQKYVPDLSVQNDRDLKKRLSAEIRQAIKNKNPVFFLVEDKGEIMGYTNIFLYPDFKNKIFMGELFIKPDRRNSGIGQSLIEFLMNWVKNHKRDIIHVTIAKTNKRAHSLFKKKGFHIIESNYVNLELTV